MGVFAHNMAVNIYKTIITIGLCLILYSCGVKGPIIF